MNAEHTPGPWRVYGVAGAWPGIDTDDGNKSIVIFGDWKEDKDDGGVRGRSFGEAEANARLIAAAPDLLEALQALEAPGSGAAMHHEVWVMVRKAIAKATGKPEASR